MFTFTSSINIFTVILENVAKLNVRK